MRIVLSFLVWALVTPLLLAQSGFAETYDATAGFEGKLIANTAYGYKVFTNKTAPAPNTITRMTFETGADGAFWGVTATTDYPQPAGTLTDVAPSGDYATAETFATPTGMTLRIRRWFPNAGGGFNNLAEINFPDVAQLNLERLVFREDYPGGVFLAGHYRTLTEPGVPVPFLVRSSNSSFEWWIQTLADIPPGSFAFIRMTTFSDGGCAVVFKTNDETKYIERFGATGASLWRRQAGWLTTTVSSLTEGPGNAAFYTVMNSPFSGPGATYGAAVAVAADGTVVFEKDLNALLGQYSVFPQYILPLPGGESVLAGHASPVFPGAASSFFIAKLDATGQVIWKKNYYYFQNGATFAFGKTTPDKGYIFTGSTDGKVFLFKIDQNGVGSANIQYCPAAADQPWQEWIAGVKTGSIQNFSGKSPYSYFGSLSTDLGIGQPATIELTAGYSYFTYDQYFGVWIDYNRDNVFDSDEMAVAAVLARPPDGTPFQLFATNFTVPASALPGPTRMRVVMQRDASPGACGNPLFGEVEDYIVDLKTVGPAPDLTTPAWEVIPANNSCFTNPGQTFGYLAGLILNTGPAGAGDFTAKAWLSPDDQFGNADDLLWQTVHYDTIAPGGAVNNPLGLNINTPVPPGTPPGFYHIFVHVDAGNALAELNEANNLFQSTTQIGAPDYFLENLTATATTSGNLNCSFEINHANTFPLAGLPGGVEVSIFLSPDDIPNNGNEVLLGSQTVGFDAFNAAGVVAKTMWLPLPGIATAGNYYLIVEVFPTAYCDQNYQNNTLVGPEIQISGQPSGAYCGAQGNFPWHEWIAGVSVADLANGSGKSRYSDFSDFTAHLTANTNATVALTAGFSWAAFDEYWKIWIDYDRDGTFEEPGEIAFQQILPKPADGTPTAILYGNILVPATALPGTTRMRVAMKRGGAPGPCEIFAFGEAEDYSVNIASSLQSSFGRANVTSMAVSQDFDLFPNPTNGEFTVLFQDGWSGEIRLFDLNGRMLTQVKIEQTTRFDLSAQPAGMYLLDIRFENGERRREKIIKE